MSTDSNELTFVRCPSCRSLVPAVATRCRMCGASLDGFAAKPKAAATTENPGRIRKNSEGIAADSSNVAQEQEPRRGKTEIVDAPRSKAEVQYDDPLSSYIDEVNLDDEPVPVMQEPISKPARTVEAKPATSKSSTPPVSSKPNPVKPAPKPENVFMDEDEEDPLKSFLEEDDEQEEVLDKKLPEKKVSMVFGDDEDDQDDDNNGDSPFRDEKPIVARKEAPKPIQQPIQQQVAKPQVEKHAPRTEAYTKPKYDNLESHTMTKPVERPEVKPQQMPRQDNPVQPKVEAPARMEAPQRPVAKELPKTEMKSSEVSSSHTISTDSNGILSAWFVDFSNTKGQAYELRSGKYFLTSKSLKASDLIIEHKSISTPHAMLVVKPQSGVVVQDLMSETGVYVARANSGTKYEKIEDRTTLNHGDKVRFGELEFVLVLIP